MNIYAFCYTKGGAEICARLVGYFSGKPGVTITGYAKEKHRADQCLLPLEGLPEGHLKDFFRRRNAIVFIGAVGIAVRKIAPFINSKATDPAVISIDEQGRFVIPLLSGHIGGANALAAEISSLLDSVCVITTATDLRSRFAVDVWAAQKGMVIQNPESVKCISADILDCIPVGLASDFPLEYPIPEGIAQRLDAESGICISIRKSKLPFPKTLLVTPRCVAVGMGCRCGASPKSCEQLLLSALEELDISPDSMCILASIDIKKDEPALLYLSEKYGLDFLTYPAEKLKSATGEFAPSSFVEQVTGVDNVCERAAVLASGGGELILRKRASNGVTIALAQRKYIVGW